MALVSTSIPNLLNGVSQQPAPLRQTTQGEEQTNALSSVIDGLIKRPPTEHLGELLGNDFTNTTVNAAIHVVETEHGVHIMVATNEPANTLNTTNDAVYVVVRVFDDSGALVSIDGSGANNVAHLDYLDTTNPARDLKFLTVGADTYILNTTVPVERAFTTGNPVLDSTHYNTFSDLPDGKPTDDGGTGDAVVDKHYKILNGSSTTSGEFFVKALSTSTYEESFDPRTYELPTGTAPKRVNFGPLATTMPCLFRLGVNANQPQYSFETIVWNKRTVGDLESAPSPSFLSDSNDTSTHKKINNIFFYKNRLGLLCEDNVIFSGAGDFYNFFPKTVRTVLDDGPIDVKVAHLRANDLKQAVTFNDSLTLFSDHTQFVIENAGALTPKTISIVASTEYENDSEVTPVGAGNYLYFPSKKGAYSSIREYAVEADTLISAAEEITAHVPKYIPKNVVKLATSSNEDILACLSSEDRTKLYIYKWYNDGPQKLQSSWSTWQFHPNDIILDVSIVESTMYLVTRRTTSGAGQVVVEKIDLQYLDDTGVSYCVRVDRKTTLTGTYDTNTDTTTWQIPYGHAGDVVCVKGGTWPTAKGTNILASMAHELGNSKLVEANGDFSAYPCIIGVPYTMTYTFSHQFVKERNATTSIQSGRLQMRTMNVNFEDTGNFTINVTPLARPTYSYEYRGVTLNQAGSIIGEVVLNDGTFRFPLQTRNDRLTVQISADTFLPCAFQSAEWEGFFNIRSKRI